MLYFSNENKLNKAKLLLEYFKNVIDNDGNIISPPNTDKNVVYIINHFLTVSLPVNDNDLDLYKHLINKLNIPKTLIKNKQILKMIGNDNIQLPTRGFIKVKPLNKKSKRKKQINLLNKWNRF